MWPVREALNACAVEVHQAAGGLGRLWELWGSASQQIKHDTHVQRHRCLRSSGVGTTWALIYGWRI